MDTETKLKRIAWLSGCDHGRAFECLMHHIDYERLKDNFDQLDPNKAVGIDGITKEEYGDKLEANLEDLLARMKRMAYIPQPVKEVLIEKEGQPGKFRPLGISILEDKIVQGAFRQVLEAIYEPIFMDCSHGFRPRRGCHTAIKDLRKYLQDNPVETVIDIDLKNFFGTIDHKILEGILREKIKDEKFIRYIIRMFKAGVLSEGELKVGEEGVPQGSICSPILANIHAHKAIDEWVEKIIQPYCKGKVKLFRYADDAIICCEKEGDATRIREALPKRLAKYKLALNEDKTKMVEFSREKVEKGISQGTFDFLGFTFYWGKTRKGRAVSKLKTSGKTLRKKLVKVEEWCKEVRNKTRLKELWGTFGAKLRGHAQYYGVSFNAERIRKFFTEATRIFFKWMNRRSQKKSFTWEEFNKLKERYPLPRAKICHPLF
jgi:group II intron reverse transcriptase/maturase